VSLTPAMIEATPPPPFPSPDINLPANAPSSSANGNDETALAPLADDGAPTAPHVEATPPASPLSLEERVRRLEDALALLHKQKAERSVAAPPPDHPPESVPSPAPPSTAILLDVGKRLLGAAASVVPPASVAVSSVAHSGERSGLLWLLWDTWAEARAIVRMFLDPRYRMSWSARVVPLLVLAAILTATIWVPGSSITIVGDLLVKLVDLVLAFVLFKWLGHEARRYRQTSLDLPPS
jgi:hypothetical protein